ncbi:general substrate transporter [Fomitopsis serialis]|uniref:general substrate transporter n=1 Tax=Fomitopsis serialis TaxID=139415 RepID=UPI002007FEEC|nr:general substrate transporter [Neoantrodia serialis]KAH9937389.1 general substrate transporter [Neoantrodia serialis]
MAIPSNRKAILLAIFIAFVRQDAVLITAREYLGGFLFGYDIGVISGCLIMDDFVDRFGEQNPDGSFTLSSSRQSIITSLLSAGTIVGAIAQAFTSDRFGRRGSILTWSFIFTIGTILQTATVRSIAQLVVGRFIAGLGVGALSAIVPLYNGETAPKALLQIIMGIFISYVIDLGTHAIKGPASWRIPVGLQIAWGMILLSGIFFLPESPRHLVGTGRTEEARKVVAELNSVPEDDPLVTDAIEELEYGIHAENDGGKATWLECFSTRNMLWKRTINGMMLQFIQQLNGQNFYYYYGDTFFKSAGTELSAYVIQVILGAVSVAGTIPALYLIDTWGRRKSLMTGALLEAACALIAALAGHFLLAPSGTPTDQLTSTNKTGGNVLIAFAILHVFGYSIFWGPTPWVYLGESFPLRVRPKAIALGSATNWVWNFLLSFFSPRIADDIGPLILLIFCGMLVFGYVYVYLFIPETKGLSLEEVDELYRARVLPWKSSSWRPAEKHLHDKIDSDSKTSAQATEIREEKSKGEDA